MRLRQIRISGFKSFADLTTIEVPSSIVGIVGPNGCGKSNVIEAVQWALGEGKASDLRCKSMSELIFAGSDNRKPAGRAMVELVFDNSDGSVPGPWGTYSEISVKRVLTRDNTSSYLINNQQVRATDIRDLFMGTGLGANSYANISQGMVTEFAKDSPEKRREYLEEAAGVSKYKKRRKEAESKLASTRANLERVSDLQVTRRESLSRLQKEAEVALKYQQLDRERAEKESLWWFVQMLEAQNAIDRINVQIAQSQSLISEKDGTIQRERERLGQLRSRLNEANVEVLGRTQSLAEVDKSISSVEGNIRSIIERRALMKTQLESYSSMLVARGEEVKKQSERIHAIFKEREEKEEVLATAQEREAALDEARQVAADKAQNLKRIYEASQQEAIALEGQSRTLSLEMAQLSKSRETLSAQLEKYRHESSQTSAPDEVEYKQLQEDVAALHEESELLLAQREEIQEALEQARDSFAQWQSQLHEKQQTHTAQTVRLAALHEMEQKALSGNRLSEWLTAQGLDSMKRLYEWIHVEPDWARALEAVLRERVNSLGISRLEMASAFELAPPPGKMTFFLTSKTEAEVNQRDDFPRLTDKVTLSDSAYGVRPVLHYWLCRCFLAPSLSEALKHRSELPDGFCFVTPQGHLIDPVSITFWAEDESSGMLSRRAEIEKLQNDEAAVRNEIESAEKRLGEERLRQADLAQNLRDIQSRYESVRRQESQTALELTRMTAAMQAYKVRAEELRTWIEEAQAQLEETSAALEETDAQFAELDEQLSQRQQRAEEARMAWENAQEAARRAEQDYNVFSYTQREVEMALRTLTERLNESQRAQMLAQNEQGELREKINSVQASLEALDEDSEREGLQVLLQKREKAQIDLSDAEKVQAQTDLEVKEAEAELGQLEEQKAIEQNRIGDYFVKRRQHEVDYATVKGRLDEMQYDEIALRERYELEHPKLNALRLEVEKTAKEIAALGAVNHAALQQLEIQTQEVERIDREVADLNEAIVTIEAAIKKIDQETRALLKDTFNRVNEAFNQKFTQLFQGGHARLEMTSDDALEAGIEMYANPPGKHNHSIRQLSGGELTLTAIALVFAFFTLNPAPFCLLDEIDAPLDEANQERLSRLVGAMSGNTQFMMITHHRVTMEHTNQLIGVTMKEPGVSRVVSVDIAEAEQYVQKSKN